VAWTVDFHDSFVAEYHGLPKDVQDELLACVALLEQFGPMLGRPRVDTLNGSRHANMKELRFDAADGVWRFAFAFDPKRKAIILGGGDKSGGSEQQFSRAAHCASGPEIRVSPRHDQEAEADREGKEVTTMTNLERIRKALSPVRRKRIAARAAHLVAEEMTLQELRQARKLTQVRMAKALGITQDGVSRLEKRSDLLLSTLRKTVEALGGSLSLVAEFRDRGPVVLSGITDESAEIKHTGRKAANA
jgi:DNA-binding XRE family transcriptional regulator